MHPAGSAYSVPLTRPARRFLLFFAVNISLIGGYVAVFFAFAQDPPEGSSRLALIPWAVIGLAAVVVVLEYPLLQRARSWRVRLVVLYFAWLLWYALLSFPALMFGPSAWMAALLSGHLIALPGYIVVAGVNYLLRERFFCQASFEMG